MELFSYPFRAMGSPCELQLYCHSREEFERCYRSAENEVIRLEKKYSRYLSNSVTSAINAAGKAGGNISLDDETAAIIDFADQCYQLSDGLFDISSGYFRNLWDFRSQQVPSPTEVENALHFVGWKKITWNRPTLTFSQPGMELDFGGCVKEYAVDAATSLLKSMNITAGVVDLGGDIGVIGPHPDGAPWLIGIRHPRQEPNPVAMIPLTSGALTSSGDYERFFIKNDQRYCHIINPETGFPANQCQSVSVMAEQAVVAGAASTIAFLKGSKKAMYWLEEMGLTYLLIDPQGNVHQNTPE